MKKISKFFVQRFNLKTFFPLFPPYLKNSAVGINKSMSEFEVYTIQWEYWHNNDTNRLWVHDTESQYSGCPEVGASLVPEEGFCYPISIEQFPQQLDQF